MIKSSYYPFIFLIYLTITGLIDQSEAAPVNGDSDEFCSVTLIPGEVITSPHQSSDVVIRCEASIIKSQFSQFIQIKDNFHNPVFDLSFGGAPRTGVYFIRGNVSCDEPNRTKCWSQFAVSPESLDHLIINSGKISFLCQVADNIKRSDKDLPVRCDGRGTIKYRKVLSFGEGCSDHINTECGEQTVCDKESQSCACEEPLIDVITDHKTICVSPAELNEKCNYNEQCASKDLNSECRFDNNGKICKCKNNFEVTDSFRQRCRRKEEDETESTTRGNKNTSETEENDLEDDDYEEENENGHTKVDNNSDNKPMAKYTDNDEPPARGTRKRSRQPNTGNVGLIVFLVAILLAILIVAIIIRVRQNSDRRIITPKKRNTRAETDGQDKSQAKPILSRADQGIDEVDPTTKQTGPNGQANPQTKQSAV